MTIGPIDFRKETSVAFLRVAAQALQDENMRLRDRVVALEGRLGDTSALAEDNAVLRELVARQQQALFGKSTERRRTGQTAGKAPPKEKTGHGPRKQPELERVTVPHELPPDERVCVCCGGELVAIPGFVEATELVSVTEQAYVLEVHESQKYRCACSEKVVTAPGPTTRLVPGGTGIQYGLK